MADVHGSKLEMAVSGFRPVGKSNSRRLTSLILETFERYGTVGLPMSTSMASGTERFAQSRMRATVVVHAFRALRTVKGRWLH